MTENQLGEVLVHYKGRYYCLETGSQSLSDASEEQERIARNATAAGTLVARLKRDDGGAGTYCYLVDADALALHPSSKGGDEVTPVVAFGGVSICAFTAHGIEGPGLSDLPGKRAARPLGEGLFVGTFVHVDGTSGGLTHLEVPSSPTPEVGFDAGDANDVVFHYRGRYHSVNAVRAQCTSTSSEVLAAAQQAIECGVKIGALEAAVGLGTMCTLVDWSALSTSASATDGHDKVAVFDHPELGMQMLDLENGQLRSVDDALRTRATEVFSFGTWLARLPPTADVSAGMTCYLVDLNALRRR